MNREKLIALAREAGFRAGAIFLSDGESLPFVAPVSATSCIVELERFAALVAAHEREKCALVCDEIDDQDYSTPATAARAIRSRKDAP